MFPSEFSKVLIAQSPQKLSFFFSSSSSAAVCRFSNSTFSVQLCTSCSVAELLPLCSAGKETKGGVFVCVCVCVRGTLTPTKNHLSTVELCHLKHDVVSALSVSSVVMSGGIFFACHAAQRCAYNLLPCSCGYARHFSAGRQTCITHTRKCRDIWLLWAPVPEVTEMPSVTTTGGSAHLSLGSIRRWLLSASCQNVVDGDVAPMKCPHVHYQRSCICFWGLEQKKQVPSPALLCSPLPCLAPFFFFFVPFRASRFPGAPGRQPGGHEEQERGESWSHPPGHEALPVPAQLLRAGHHPGRLHPGRRSGPGAFFCFVFFKHRLLLFCT